MDKLPNQKGKITIKINGEPKKREEPLKIYDWQHARKEMSATNDYRSNRDRTYMPKNNAFYKLKNRKRFRLPRKKPGSSRKVKNQALPTWIIAIISAVVIGALIGIILLNVMIRDGKESEEAQVEGGNIEREMLVEREQLLLPPVEFIFLQQGVYKSENSFQELLGESELPLSYIQIDGMYHVFAGVVHSLDSAKTLQQQPRYEEMFPKPVTTKEKIFSEVKEHEKQFLERAYSFYSKLVQTGTQVFITKQDVNLTDLEEAYEQITASELDKEQLEALQTSLVNGYEALKIFIESKKEDDWFQLQKHLLQFATDYYSL